MSALGKTREREQNSLARRVRPPRSEDPGVVWPTWSKIRGSECCVFRGVARCATGKYVYAVVRIFRKAVTALTLHQGAYTHLHTVRACVCVCACAYGALVCVCSRACVSLDPDNVPAQRCGNKSEINPVACSSSPKSKPFDSEGLFPATTC